MNRRETKLSGLIFHEDVLIDNANEAVGKVWWDFPDSLAYTKNSDTKRFVTLLRSYSAGVSGCCCAAFGCAVPKFGATALGIDHYRIVHLLLNLGFLLLHRQLTMI